MDPLESAMAYDPSVSAVVAVDANLTGTSSSSLTWTTPAITWSYSAGNWTALPLSTGPPPLIWASMAYDAHDGYLLLFGGMDLAQGNTAANPWATVNYTWTYSNGTWTNLSGSLGSAPPPTVESRMVYDAADGRIVLLDTALGWGPEYTWTFSNGTWTNVTGAESAELPKFGGLAYDSADGYVLYFGGERAPNASRGGPGIDANTTWAFRNGSWSNISASVVGAPSPRALASVAYDSSLGSVLLFGGQRDPPTSTATYLNDSYTYANGTWSPLPWSSAPSPRGGAKLVDDPADGTVVCAGGSGTVPNVAANGSVVDQYADLADTWTFGAGTWTLQSPSILPARPIVDLGTPLRLDVQGPAAGVEGHLVFLGLPPGCPSQSAPTLSCTPTTTGTFRPTAEIVTSAGSIGWAYTILQINPDPVVRSFVVSSPQVTVGGSVSLTSVAELGTGPLAYDYTGLPPGCVPSDSAVLSCRPSVAGAYEILLRVTDTVGGSASATVALLVVPAAAPPPPPIPGHGPRNGGLFGFGSIATSGGNGFVTGVLVGLGALLLVGAWAGWRIRILRDGAKLTRTLEGSGESATSRPSTPPGAP